MQKEGCDLVGMTGMPEAALARELHLDYASLCIVTNRAAGLSEQPVSTQEIEHCLSETRPVVEALIDALQLY